MSFPLRSLTHLLVAVALVGCAPSKWRGAVAWWNEWELPDGTRQLEVAINRPDADPRKHQCLVVSDDLQATLDGQPLEVKGHGGGAGFTYTGPGSETVGVPDAECRPWGKACCKAVRLSGRTSSPAGPQPRLRIRDGRRTFELTPARLDPEQRLLGAPYLTPPNP